MDSQGTLPSSHYMTALIQFPDRTFSTAVEQGESFDANLRTGEKRCHNSCHDPVL